MRYPTLNEQSVSREMINAFGGYNHNLLIGNGEFYDMKNMTSADYPVLSSRANRGIYVKPTAASGMVAKDSLCYVDGRNFVINEYSIDMGLSDEPKSLISMGAYVIIMPDKKYINTADHADRGSIEASVSTEGAVTFSLCKADGEGYGTMAVQNVAPSQPKNMDLWLDTSQTPNGLKQYSETNAMWISIASTYIKISAAGIGAPFSVGDGVRISGIESEKLSDLNNTMIIMEKSDDFIVVAGIIDSVITQNSPITVSRRMPNMDFVIESQNRLWGCRYGTDIDGNIVNELYACKLGDFKNWHCFNHISTDSYVAPLGSDGQFTGAITHLGFPIFFKENYMHKVYGNFPSNYQIQTTACRGVQKGCEKSLAIVNEILYYKSRSAVCAYDGSLPVEMSSALGNISYSDAAAGAIGNKYYISMKDEAGIYHLFVYDSARGMWHREDNTRAREFCSCRNDLYFIDNADGYIKTVNGGKDAEKGAVEWMVETGIIGTNSPDKKYISRLDVRMSLDIETTVDFYAQYDSMGEWEHLFTMIGNSLRSFAVPIRPKRCDHLKLRIEGKGQAKIYSICKTIERGSDS